MALFFTFFFFLRTDQLKFEGNIECLVSFSISLFQIQQQVQCRCCVSIAYLGLQLFSSSATWLFADILWESFVRKLFWNQHVSTGFKSWLLSYNFVIYNMRIIMVPTYFLFLAHFPTWEELWGLVKSLHVKYLEYKSHSVDIIIHMVFSSNPNITPHCLHSILFFLWKLVILIRVCIPFIFNILLLRELEIDFSFLKTNRRISTLNYAPWIMRSILKCKNLTTGSVLLP